MQKKLHAICDELGQLLSAHVTTANIDDREGLDKLVKFFQGDLIADAGYLSKDKQEQLARQGVNLFTAARNNMKKLMTQEQHDRLKKRSIIESVFSVLKDRMGMVTSLARSIKWHSVKKS